jgi:hypothetical protein
LKTEDSLPTEQFGTYGPDEEAGEEGQPRILRVMKPHHIKHRVKLNVENTTEAWAKKRAAERNGKP